NTSVYPNAPGGRLPGNPSTRLPDPLIWLTWVAAATTRLRFMTAVMILPQRNPLVLAKEVATLDYLSGGRFELGIGVGWLKEEFEALGIPFVRRSAEQAGRDPAKVELILGCPGALPKSGTDPRSAVEERIAQGAGRLALPVTAFMPDLETTLARFGEEIIKPYANA